MTEHLSCAHYIPKSTGVVLKRAHLCDNLHGRPSLLLARPAIDQSQLFSHNRDLCPPHLYSTPPLGRGPRRNIAVRFVTEKQEWFGYPVVKKMKIRLLVLTEFTNVTDGRTDGQTDTA